MSREATGAEIAFVRDNWGTMPKKQIIKELHISYHTLSQWVKQFGLSGEALCREATLAIQNGPTDEQWRQIRAARAAGGSRGECARAVRVTEYVLDRWIALGRVRLPKRGRRRKMCPYPERARYGELYCCTHSDVNIGGTVRICKRVSYCTAVRPWESIYIAPAVGG